MPDELESKYDELMSIINSMYKEGFSEYEEDRLIELSNEIPEMALPELLPFCNIIEYRVYNKDEHDDEYAYDIIAKESVEDTRVNDLRALEYCCKRIVTRIGIKFQSVYIKELKISTEENKLLLLEILLGSKDPSLSCVLWFDVTLRRHDFSLFTMTPDIFDCYLCTLIQMTHDESSAVKCKALEVLGTFGNSDINQYLLEILKTEKDPEALSLALFYIGKICNPESIDSVVLLLKNNYLYDNCIKCLKEISNKVGLEGIKKVFKKYKIEKKVILDIGVDISVLPILKKQLETENTTIQIHAVQMISLINDNKAIKVLINALGDKSYKVRGISARYLGRMQVNSEKMRNDIGKYLIDLLCDDQWYVRKMSALSLGDLKIYQALKPLTSLLSDSDKDVKQAATQSIEKILQDIKLIKAKLKNTNK